MIKKCHFSVICLLITMFAFSMNLFKLPYIFAQEATLIRELQFLVEEQGLYIDEDWEIVNDYFTIISDYTFSEIADSNQEIEAGTTLAEVEEDLSMDDWESVTLNDQITMLSQIAEVGNTEEAIHPYPLELSVFFYEEQLVSVSLIYLSAYIPSEYSVTSSEINSWENLSDINQSQVRVSGISYMGDKENKNNFYLLIPTKDNALAGQEITTIKLNDLSVNVINTLEDKTLLINPSEKIFQLVGQSENLLEEDLFTPEANSEEESGEQANSETETTESVSTEISPPTSDDAFVWRNRPIIDVDSEDQVDVSQLGNNLLKLNEAIYEQIQLRESDRQESLESIEEANSNEFSNDETEQTEPSTLSSPVESQSSSNESDETIDVSPLDDYSIPVTTILEDFGEPSYAENNGNSQFIYYVAQQGDRVLTLELHGYQELLSGYIFQDRDARQYERLPLTQEEIQVLAEHADIDQKSLEERLGSPQMIVFRRPDLFYYIWVSLANEENKMIVATEVNEEINDIEYTTIELEN